MTNRNAQRLTPNALCALSVATLSLCGCHGDDSDGYKTWAAAPKLYSPGTDSGNAYDAYAQAAARAEQDGAKYLGRVSFFPGQRKEVEDRISGSVKAVTEAERK